MSTALLEAPAPEAGTPHRRPRRRAVAAAVAVVVLAAVTAVLVTRGATRSGPPAPAPAGSVAGVPEWFAAASGPTCQDVAGVSGLPGVVGAVSCRPSSDIRAAFGRLGSPAAATQYLSTQFRAHPGALLTGWVAGGPSGRGEVLFFSSHGGSTLVWAYAGQPYVGWASSSRPAKELEAWWTAAGRTAALAG